MQNMACCCSDQDAAIAVPVAEAAHICADPTALPASQPATRNSHSCITCHITCSLLHATQLIFEQSPVPQVHNCIYHISCLCKCLCAIRATLYACCAHSQVMLVVHTHMSKHKAKAGTYAAVQHNFDAQPCSMPLCCSCYAIHIPRFIRRRHVFSWRQLHSCKLHFAVAQVPGFRELHEGQHLGWLLHHLPCQPQQQIAWAGSPLLLHQ